jgi:hypothetical protein
VNLDDLTVAPPPAGPADWNDDGFVILKNFLPEDLMVAYEECWLRDNKNNPGGWQFDIPYMAHPELMDVVTYKPLADQLESLIGEPAGVHLNLTGWISTQRDWHQDSYLNPPHVGDFYAAIWVALDDIHPDSGPFQFVPGSHRWPQVTREKILKALSEDEQGDDWPKHSERLLSPMFEAEIEKRDAEVVSHLASRGDVLIWHGRLLHRGSAPNVLGMERRSLIAHYSGVNHREDMPEAVQSESGGWYFPIRSNKGMEF